MDYILLNQVIIFNEAVSNMSVNVTIINDDLVEDTEMFLVRMSVITSGTDIVFSSSNNIPISIIDNDSESYYYQLAWLILK